MRACEQCHAPLPDGCHPTRQFCSACRRERDTTRMRERYRSDPIYRARIRREQQRARMRARKRERPARACEQCGEPLPIGCRPNRRFCCDNCKWASAWAKRQRQRLKTKLTKSCEHCGDSLPEGCRTSRRFCDACQLQRQRDRQREWQRKRWLNDREHLNALRRERRQSDEEYRERFNEVRRERYRSDPAIRESIVSAARSRRLAEVGAQRDAMAIDPVEIARRIQVKMRDEAPPATSVRLA